jgi:PIN domain nuclease of toxin-antitoxin system
MKLLLDTHVLLWFLTKDANLSARAHGAIEAPATLAHVSAATLWEVTIKLALGKLKLPAPYADIFPHHPFQLAMGTKNNSTNKAGGLCGIVWKFRQ